MARKRVSKEQGGTGDSNIRAIEKDQMLKYHGHPQLSVHPGLSELFPKIPWTYGVIVSQDTLRISTRVFLLPKILFRAAESHRPHLFARQCHEAEAS